MQNLRRRYGSPQLPRYWRPTLTAVSIFAARSRQQPPGGAARRGMGKQRADRGDGGGGRSGAAATERGGVAKPPRDGGEAGTRAPPSRWTKEQKRAAAEARRAEAAAAPPWPPRGDASEPPPARRRGAAPSQHGSQHGSHFAHGASGMVNDEWQTTQEAWAEVAQVLLPAYRDKCCWQPFFYDGECAKHLRHLGFTRVLHEDADFFQKVHDAAFMATVDFIWDNPPYTASDTKDAVLRALVATGKPFCVLLPSSVVYSQLFREVLDPARVQLVLPRRVRVCKTGLPPVPFKFMAWVCYNMGLERDLYLIGE